MASKPLPQLTADENQRTDKITWEGHVLIPLAQNIAGGLALSGILIIVGDTLTGSQEIPAWALMVGATATCLITLVRFFADDWGILARAYDMGARSRDGEVNALQLELRAARDALANTDPNSESDKRNEVAQRTRQHAIKIVERSFENLPTTRKAMAEAGIGQQDWQRACRLLRAAGVIDEQGGMTCRTLQAALKRLDERLNGDAAHGSGFTPKWQ